jgi:hypothetical protein
MNAMNRTLRLASGLALAVILGACGSDDPTPPTPVTTPTPAPMRTIILSGSGSLPARTIDVEPFTTAATGTLDITVDWTFPASPFGVYVVRGECNLDQFNARACNFLTRSETGQKPRMITLPSFAAGSYFLLIGNFSEVDESFSLQVGLTTGGGVSSADTANAAAERPDGRFAGKLKGMVSR